MRISDWPEQDRPREKLLSKGEGHLTEAELLAVLLKTGTKGKTALDLAKELLLEYGNLKNVLSTPQLIKKPGIGQTKLATLKAAVELGRRYLMQDIPAGDVLNNSQITKKFLTDRLRHHPIEVFACLFMDTHCRLLAFEELFQGTLTEAAVYPREIIKRSLTHQAAKLILAHNHPSGHATPSHADKELTHSLKKALALVDIEVIDHIIIGNPENFSFMEAGILHS
jgi:DNA repair protein RadC